MLSEYGISTHHWSGGHKIGYDILAYTLYTELINYSRYDILCRHIYVQQTFVNFGYSRNRKFALARSVRELGHVCKCMMMGIFAGRGGEWTSLKALKGLL